MLLIAVVMLVILVLAGTVLLFFAFPHRGQEMSRAPWLGEALGRAAEVVPTVRHGHEERGDDAGVHGIFGDDRS